MAALLGVGAAACSGNGAPPGSGGAGGHGAETGGAGATGGVGSPGGSGGGATTGDQGGGGAGGGVFTLNPGHYDCTATKPPARVNAIPMACATDPGCPTRLVSGYRGAGDELGNIAPFDTVSAIRAAIVMGLDFVDTDPRVTKDGFLVNIPFSSVNLTTDGTGDVKDLTLAQIQAMKVKAIDVYGKPYPGDFSCERVPTLEEVLETAKGKLVVLVDADTNNRVDLLVAAIQSTGMVGQAIFESASTAKIDEALALEPLLLTAIRVASKDDLQASLDHFAEHPPVLVELLQGASPIVLIPLIHAAGNRALYNVFAADSDAAFSGQKDTYDKVMGWGIDVMRSSRPDLALVPLDRWPPAPQPQ